MESTGVVRAWHADEGWGVLDSPDTPGGCWVHFSEVEVDGLRSLVVGEEVRFTVEAVAQDGFAFRAERVRPVGRGRTAPPAGDPDGSGAALGSVLALALDDGAPAGADLLAEVDRAFHVTGAATPGWPDPHPDRAPADQEYSRCSDPGRYRILETRADAWARVLAARGLAVVDDAPPLRRFTPAAPGGLALHLVATGGGAEPPGLDVVVARPDGAVVLLDRLPGCGCDACDSGSADLLRVLDGWVLAVARGGVLHARQGDAHVTRTIDGWSSSGGLEQATAWLDESVAPDGVERWVGAPWR